MKFSGPKTLSFTFLRSLLSTVPHSSSRNDPGYTHTHIYNVEFVSDTTRIFHYSDGDTIVLASNLAFETSNNLEPVFQMCITFRIPKQVKTFGNKLSNLLILRQLLYATFDHRELKNFTNSILYVYVIIWMINSFIESFIFINENAKLEIYLESWREATLFCCERGEGGGMAPFVREKPTSRPHSGGKADPSRRWPRSIPPTYWSRN